MIIGTGIDIIEIERIEKAISVERFIQRVYSEAEIEYCASRGAQAAASYAARFAGKEAVLKAFGTGLVKGKLKEIEILPDEKGAPKVHVYGYFKELSMELGVESIHISLSHARQYAVAQAIFWGEIE